MASYHFSAQIISRAKGRSALAAAAYRAGERLRDETTGDVFDYSRRRGVAHTEILLPDNAAPWLADREKLWNHAQQIEKRRDAQLARECNLALPVELSATERLELVRGFIRERFTRHGMVADLAIHEPTDNDARNHHAHVMLTLRKGTPTGLYRVKTREWNSDSLLKEWREAWAGWQNAFLAQGQHRDRVDHRTLAAQREDAQRHGDRTAVIALDRPPEIHIGPQAQRAGRRPTPPGSQLREHALARAQGGVWRSSAQAQKRVRTIDYVRIDHGTRASFNARRTAQSTAVLSRLVGLHQLRNARLRLIETRNDRLIRGRRDVLHNIARDRQRLAHSPPELIRLDGLEMLVRQQLGHYQRRSQLIRQLLGRADRLLANMFRVEAHALTRSQALCERLKRTDHASHRFGGGLVQKQFLRLR